MTQSKIPYLCGGILFSLILEARKTRTKARDKYNGGTDKLNATNVMLGLVEVFTGDSFDSGQGKTFGKSTTQFRTCQEYGPTYIPFTNSTVISSFNTSLKRKDSDLLKRMSEFVSIYINEVRSEWLVKAILEVIQNDKDITDDKFFAISQTEAISKKRFEEITIIELPVFLLSVWGFIINERKDNTKGRPTFEAWYTHDGPRSPWKYNANIGNSNTKTIIVKTKCDAIKTDTIKASPTPQNSKNFDDDKNSSSFRTTEASGSMPFTEIPKLIVENLCEQDVLYLKQFRVEVKPILKYCIINDPSGGETKIGLSDEIDNFIRDWQYIYREIEDKALRLLVAAIMNVLDEYTYYISEKFLRFIPDKGVLWFKNESIEEGELLRNILRPETLKKRYEMQDLYLRLYPIPEDKEIMASNQNIIHKQINIEQNGNNNLCFTNKGTMTINM